MLERGDVELNRLIMRLDKVRAPSTAAARNSRARGAPWRSSAAAAAAARWALGMGHHRAQLRPVYEQAGAGQISAAVARGGRAALVGPRAWHVVWGLTGPVAVQGEPAGPCNHAEREQAIVRWDDDATACKICR